MPHKPFLAHPMFLKAVRLHKMEIFYMSCALFSTLSLYRVGVKTVNRLPAVLAWVGYISWVGSFSDITAHFAVSV